MDLNSIIIEYDSVLAMGTLIVAAFAGVWAVKRVIQLIGYGYDDGIDPLDHEDNDRW